MKLLTFLIFLTIFGLSHCSLGKLQPSLLEALKTKSHVDILIQFESTDQVLKKFENTKFASREEKASTLAKALKTFSENSQKSLLDLLKSRKSPAELKTLRISNILWVKSADLDLIRLIASKSEVKKIYEDGIVTLEDPIIHVNQSASDIEQSDPIAWGVTQVRAPEVWQTYKLTGKGVIIGIIDTGVNLFHNDLFRKFDGGWFDPYGETRSAYPTDNNGHGTHCIGSVLGSKEDGTRITGVAPDASWIAARGLNSQGSGSFSILLDCLEWTATCTESDPYHPYPCSKIPHIVTNSWGGGSSTSDPIYDNVLNFMDFSNILVVFAAGNSGPSCSTIGFPANTVNPMTRVGATDKFDTIAYFSSRGPSPKNVINPDVSAPGVGIFSCWKGDADATNTISGTSMATPHVAGVYALLREKYSTDTHNNDFIRNLVKQTCVPPPLNVVIPSTCPNKPPQDPPVWPNNHYGYGRVDAFKACGIAPS